MTKTTLVGLLLAMVAATTLNAMVASADTQAGTNEAACAGQKSAEACLHQTYDLVLKSHASDTQFVERFKAAQRAWLVFRDAELKAVYPSSDPQAYGSALPMCQCLELTQLTLERVKQLQSWSKSGEGDVCAGSRKS